MALAEVAAKKRTLPEDPGEFYAVTKRYQLMVRPFVSGFSKLCVMMGVEPLDTGEVNSGVEAWAALAYEEGVLFGGRAMVILWLGGTVAPRLLAALGKALRARRDRELAARGIPPPPTTPPLPQAA